MTGDGEDPIQTLKSKLSHLMSAMCGQDAVYGGNVRLLYLEVEKVFDSPEFVRYRESFGKTGMMAETVDPETTELIEGFGRVLNYWDNFVQERGDSQFVVDHHCVSSLYTELQVMRYNQDTIDKILAWSALPSYDY